MRLLFLLILSHFCVIISAQKYEICPVTEDTLNLIHVEIYQKNNHLQDLWCTSKNLPFDSLELGSTILFMKSLAKYTNYCPSLPEGYRDKILNCLKDSGRTYLENNPYPVEIFRKLKKSKPTKNLVFNDKSFVIIKTLRIRGLFWVSDITTENFQTVSTEFPTNKDWFSNNIVLTPFKTSVIKKEKR